MRRDLRHSRCGALALGCALAVAGPLFPVSVEASEPTCTTARRAGDGGAVGPESGRDVVILDQALADALRNLGQVMGVPVAVSKRIDGRITGRRWQDRPCAVLDEIASEFALQLYFDGLTLHVTTAAEAETVMIVLSHSTAADLGRRLDQLRISDPRYPLRPSDDGVIVRVSGPPRYVALVKEAASAIEYATNGRTPAAAIARAGGYTGRYSGGYEVVRGYTRQGVEP